MICHSPNKTACILLEFWIRLKILLNPPGFPQHIHCQKLEPHVLLFESPKIMQWVLDAYYMLEKKLDGSKYYISTYCSQWTNNIKRTASTNWIAKSKTGNSKDFMRRPVFNSGHRFLSKLVFAMTINVKYTLQNSYRYNFLSQWKVEIMMKVWERQVTFSV